MFGKTCFGAIAILAMTTACTTRFEDNFDTDTTGAQPATQPAGMPDDQLFSLEGSGTVRVTASGAINGAKSMQMRGPASRGAASNPIVFMYAEPISDRTEPVYANWQGRLTSGASAQISFFGGHFDSMLRIELEDGVVIVNGQQVGTYVNGEVHRIFVSANPETDMFSVSALDGVDIPGGHEGPVLNPSNFPYGNIGLTMLLTEGGTSDSYTVDDVFMSERNPQ